jgi:NAD(P)H-flavin reductase
MKPEPFTVKKRQKETADTFTIELECNTGEFDFQPGQFNMLYAFGVGEAPISISSHRDHECRLSHTVREVGSVTTALGKLRKGDLIGVRGPFGSTWPLEQLEDKDVLVVAGGIGLAPLRPAIEHVLANRERFGRFAILYGARTPSDLLYRKDLSRWSSRLDTEVMVSVDRASRGWRGSVGVITTLIRNAPIQPKNAIVLVCGPEIMMHYAILHLNGKDFSDEQIFVSMERNMRCAEGRCGHCQFGSYFVCKDGPVFRFDKVSPFFETREF